MDSTCISTLCLSSMASYAREPCRNPKSCNLTSQSHARPRQSREGMRGNPAGTLKVGNCTSRSVARPRQSMVKIDASRQSNGGEKCVILLRIFDFDLANPWEGSRVTPKMCHFTTRSVARPRQSIVKIDASRKICHFTTRSVARPGQSMVKIDASRQTVGKNVSFYFAFSILT